MLFEGGTFTPPSTDSCTAVAGCAVGEGRQRVFVGVLVGVLWWAVIIHGDDDFVTCLYIQPQHSL